MARPSLFKHRKLARLSTRLRSQILAVGVLETLWHVCGETCDDRVGTAADVAFALKWTEKRVNIACVLHESGFLDCDDHGNYVVHDFWDHCPQYVTRRRERENKRHVDGTATKATLAADRAVASLRLGSGVPVDSTPVSEQSGTEQSGTEQPLARVEAQPISLGRRTSLVPGRDANAAFQCDVFSVPRFLHEKFRKLLANAHETDPEAALMAWYRRLRDEVDGRELPGEITKWLPAEYDRWRQPPPVANAKVIDPEVAAWVAGGR